MKFECERHVNKDNFETRVSIQDMALTDFANEFVYTLHHFIWGVLEVTELKSQGWIFFFFFFRGVDRTWNSVWNDEAQDSISLKFVVPVWTQIL